jgi:hypothetical protein
MGAVSVKDWAEDGNNPRGWLTKKLSLVKERAKNVILHSVPSFIGNRLAKTKLFAESLSMPRSA